MPKMPKFKKGDLVKFTKRISVFNKSDFTEFQVKKGTEAKVVADHDVGPISACLIKLKRDDGKVIFGETDSRYLAKVKK
jgi:hypothetical protein